MSALGKRLRELRQSREFGVREFAELIEKSAGYVSRIEGRGEIPSPELLCKIAGIYQVEPAELLELAKQIQLKQIEEDIDIRQASALALFRKEGK